MPKNVASGLFFSVCNIFVAVLQQTLQRDATKRRKSFLRVREKMLRKKVAAQRAISFVS